MNKLFIALIVLLCAGCDERPQTWPESMNVELKTESSMGPRRGQYHVEIDAYIEANSPAEAIEKMCQRVKATPIQPEQSPQK